MHAFEHQESRQTLAQGIAEYSRSEPNRLTERELSPRSKAFFRCHDVVHVVYGCGNALTDEAIVKIASMAGTSAGLGVLKGYQQREFWQIYGRLGIGEILLALFQALLVVPRTFIRCLRQHRRWPWDAFEPYLQVPLCDIRREFGIQVAHAGAGQGGSS